MQKEFFNSIGQSYGKSSNTMARTKSLAASVTVQFFAFV